MNGHHADAVATLFEDRRFGGLRILGRQAQLVDEAAKREPAARLVLARELRDMQHVGKRLFARASQHQPNVPPGDVEQLLDGLGHRSIVPAAMETLEHQQRLHNRLQVTNSIGVGARSAPEWLREPERVHDAEALLPLEQLLVADREQRPPQRREHRQLIVRPLDRGERCPDGLDLFAVVKGLASDEHMAHAAGLECADVRLRDVFAEADESAEQQADVFGGHANRTPAAALCDHPAALGDQPVHEGRGRVRQRSFNLFCRDIACAVWLGHG